MTTALADTCEQSPQFEDAPEERDASALPHLRHTVALGALALAACGGDGADPATPGSGGSTPPPPTNAAKPATDEQAARFLLQTGFSASTENIATLKTQGYEPWLDAQIAAPMDISGLDWLASRGFSNVDANKWYGQDKLGDYMIWNQLMSGSGEARKRAALALSEIMVASLNGLTGQWKPQAMARYWDILNNGAFGTYRALLEAVTLNPSMGMYLNTRGNRAADPTTGREPDENYGREVMQLFSIGLYELNSDGTPKLGGDGKQIETYTNEDVTGLAKVFTGYDLDFTNNVTSPVPGSPDQTLNGFRPLVDPMTADYSKWQRVPKGSYHSTEAKSFLGTTIPAGTSAQESLRIALDTLSNHPNTAPFISRQLIQKLVTSNPSPAYVSRVAAVFANNGNGVRGDLKAVFKAVWLDPEALSAETMSSPTFGKLREPIVRLAQWARTFGARSVSGNWTVPDLSDPRTELGQSPLRSPSVFNFYRPGYVPANSNAAANGMVAPEFQLVDEIRIAGYLNFMASVIQASSSADIRAEYSGEVSIAHDSGKLLDRLDLLLTAGRLSDTSRSTIRAALDDVAVNETSDEVTRLRRVYVGVMLTMAAPEYLVQV